MAYYPATRWSASSRLTIQQQDGQQAAGLTIQQQDGQQAAGSLRVSTSHY